MNNYINYKSKLKIIKDIALTKYLVKKKIAHY